MVEFRGVRTESKVLIQGSARLGRLMLHCKMTGAELARRVDVHENTVGNWRNGRAAIPGAVFAYLELLVAVRELGRD